MMQTCYRVFHGFGQAKFVYCGSILGSSQSTPSAPAASVNDAQFKSTGGPRYMRSFYLQFCVYAIQK